MINKELLQSIINTLEEMNNAFSKEFSFAHSTSTDKFKEIYELASKLNTNYTPVKYFPADEKKAKIRDKYITEYANAKQISIIQEDCSDELKLATLTEYFDRIAHLSDSIRDYTTRNTLINLGYSQKDKLIKFILDTYPEKAVALPSLGKQNAKISVIFNVGTKFFSWHSQDVGMLTQEFPPLFYDLLKQFLYQRKIPLSAIKDLTDLEQYFGTKITDQTIRIFLDSRETDKLNESIDNASRIKDLLRLEKETIKTHSINVTNQVTQGEFTGGGSYEEEKNSQLKIENPKPSPIRSSEEISEIITSSNDKTIQKLLRLVDNKNIYYGFNMSDIVKMELLYTAFSKNIITKDELTEHSKETINSIIINSIYENRLELMSCGKDSEIKTDWNKGKKFLTLRVKSNMAAMPIRWELPDELAKELADSGKVKKTEGRTIRETNNLPLIDELSTKQTNQDLQSTQKNNSTKRSKILDKVSETTKEISDALVDEPLINVTKTSVEKADALVEKDSTSESLNTKIRSDNEIWENINSSNDETIKKLLELIETDKICYGFKVNEIIKVELLKTAFSQGLITKNELENQELELFSSFIESATKENRIEIKSYGKGSIDWETSKKLFILKVQTSITAKPLAWEISNDLAKTLVSLYNENQQNRIQCITGRLRDEFDNISLLEKIATKKEDIKKVKPSQKDDYNISPKDEGLNPKEKAKNTHVAYTEDDLDELLNQPEQLLHAMKNAEPQIKAMLAAIIYQFFPANFTEKTQKQQTTRTKRNGGPELG